MNSFWRDVIYTGRTLQRNPGFAAIALLTLALGIGANTAIFSVLNAVVLKKLPYPEPEQLVQMWEDPSGKGTDFNSVSGGIFTDWQQQAHSFQQLSAFWGVEANLTGNGQPERLSGAQVSASFFDLLQIKPAMGRGFLPEEGMPGRNQVVILSHALWQQRFGGASNILTQNITLDGLSFNVIGVLPPSFQFPWRKAQYWVPFGWGSTWWHQSRENNRLWVFARLKPGRTIEQARSEMNVITGRLKSVYPGYKKGWGCSIISLNESLTGDVRKPLLILMGAVVLVLLIACVNVTNLIFVRITSRQRELAIRTAVGAGRWRLVRQLQTESLTLALLGGFLGVLLAYGGMDVLIAFSPQALPRLHEAGIEGSVLAFSVGLSLLAGVLCGLAPAWNASKIILNETLKSGGHCTLGGTPQRWSRGLVISEVALALILLAGAGLFLRSFQKLYSIHPGFQSSRVLTMQLSLPPSRYATGESKNRFFQEVTRRIESLPGVESAGVSTGLPFEGAHDNGVVLKGRPNQEYFGADYDFVTPDFFATLGIPLVKGQPFASTARQNSPAVTIVNEAFVQQCLPNEDPIGKHIIENGSQEMEIVGVVGNIRNRSLALPSRPQYYKPMSATDWNDFHLFVQTRDDLRGLIAPVRAAVLAADPNQPVANIRALSSVLSESISGANYLMVLSGSFGATALLLATLGVYGVMAYTVARRIQEIGVRLALGARSADILYMVLRQGMVTVSTGLLFGLGGVFILTRFLQAMLFEISPTDPATIAMVILILASAAALACHFPARRAARVDPVVSLRNE